MTDAVAARPETLPAQLDPQALIERAIDAGAGIDTMERLFALAKEMREVKAKEAWYAAISEFQKDCPPIKKTATAKIQTRGGTGYTYRYAPLDEITSVIAPVMGRLGLSVSWRSRVEPEQVIVSCRVSHTLGHHEESGEIAIPISQGAADGMGATPPQRVGIASTYAKRYSLLSIIGMAPEDDDDAGSAGDGQREPTMAGAPQPHSGGGQNPDSPVTENQIKRLMAIAGGKKWTEEQIHELISGFGYNSRKEILVKDYERICDKLKQDPPGKPA
jgi:ERF superfamily